MCEMWKTGSSLEGSGSFTRTSFRNTGCRRERVIQTHTAYEILRLRHYFGMKESHRTSRAVLLPVCVCVCLTGLYILSCVLFLELNSLSGPEELNCLDAYVKSRKSLKRKAHSSLLLFTLNIWKETRAIHQLWSMQTEPNLKLICPELNQTLLTFPLWSSFLGPRQLVRESKTRFYWKRENFIRYICVCVSIKQVNFPQLKAFFPPQIRSCLYTNWTVSWSVSSIPLLFPHTVRGSESIPVCQSSPSPSRPH